MDAQFGLMMKLLQHYFEAKNDDMIMTFIWRSWGVSMQKSWEIAPSTSARRLGAMLSMGVTVEDADNCGRFGTASSSLSSGLTMANSGNKRW
eukprot:CAMPEP_0201608030 /NCGR_PEP_ID=MMETSP0492-20130828/6940_1 /ASSEMBLY_ACC=CAM_ASM_000837 /TAXON_ID=420259 /ORGANISM="Thalassiosira gravida, Strain GMp14c1" /LENGTH=91 /DNA_ID=CAMNT_0048072729 /DNA_START=130 /DNA_END=406 /DNA_ORIENTATION=-